MKHRNGIIFALCALTGAIGFGCSDDSSGSSNEEQKNGNSMKFEKVSDLSKNQEISVKLTYVDADGNGLANQTVSLVSSQTDCIAVSENASTNDKGEATVKIKAVGEGCSSEIKASSGEDNTTVTVKVVAAGEPKNGLSIDGDKSVSKDKGGKLTISYTADGAPVADKVITITSVSKDADGNAMTGDCVSIDNKSVKTGADGKAVVSTSAVGADCNTEFTAVSGDLSAKFTVSAEGNDKADVGSVLEFRNTAGAHIESMTLSPNDSDANTRSAVVNFVDGFGKPVPSSTVKFEISNTECVSLPAYRIKTDDDGDAQFTLNISGNDCSAVVTASVGSGSFKAEDKLTVNVTAKTEYDLKLDVFYNNTNRFDSIKYLKAHPVTNGCDSWNDSTAGSLTDYSSTLQSDAVAQEIKSPNPYNLLYSFVFSEGSNADADPLSVAYNAIVVVASDGNNGSKPIAYGCVPVSIDDSKNGLTVELMTVIPDISGDYQLVTNIDFLSSFPKTDSFDVVEKMDAAQWVYFLTKFFETPLDGLWDFVWINSVKRLDGIDFGNSTVNNIIKDWVVGDFTKNMAWGYLKPMLEGYLVPGEGANENWYSVITKISPNVADLVRNMQFVGKMHIKSASGGVISGAQEEYQRIEYGWPKAWIKDGSCSSIYAADNECRQSIALGSNALTGKTWGGKVTIVEDGAVPDMLNINDHPVTFKWASVIYNVIFGTVLPRALNYADDSMVTTPVKSGTDDTAVEYYRYITAFLNKLVFGPVVSNYVDNYAGKDVTDKEGNSVKYPALSSSPDKPCEQFIESLVYLIAKDKAQSFSGAISVVANYACGEKGLGQVDLLVVKQLNKLEMSSEGKIMMKSDSCQLTANTETNQYSHMGKPDSPIKPVDKVTETSPSVRCKWEMTVPWSQSKVNGLFHAERNK